MRSRKTIHGKIRYLLSIGAVAATFGLLGHANPDSTTALDEFITNDQSDLEISEVYVPAADELATDEEFLDELKNEKSTAGAEEATSIGPGDKKKSAPPKPGAKKRKIKVARMGTEKFVYTDAGGMKPPGKLCSLFMDAAGNYNSYGRVVKEYILEDVKKKGSSLYLSDNLVGMESSPGVCPNWKSFSDAEKIKFWVWAFAATAFEESDCKANIRDKFDINDYAVGLFQLERSVKMRGRRGPNCMVSAKDIHAPRANIRCAMDMIKYQLTPISTPEFTQSGRLYSAKGQTTNSYFYWLRQADGGDIGRHIQAYSPCRQKQLLGSQNVSPAQKQPSSDLPPWFQFKTL